MTINKSQIFSQIISYLKKYTLLCIIGYILMLFSVGLSLIIPFLVQNVINDFSLITVQMGGMIVGILLLGFLTQALSTYMLEIVGNKVTKDIREDFWSKMLYGKIIDIDKIQSGELSSRLLNDTLAIASFVSFQLPNMVFDLVRLVVALGIMLYIDYILTLILLVVIPCVLLTILPISQKIHLLSEKQQTLLGDVNSYFTERISQLRLIKAYGAEKQENAKGAQKIGAIYMFENSRAKVIAVLTPMLGCIVTLLLLSMIGIGLYRINMGYVTAGTLIAFLLYFYEAMTPIQTVGNFIVEVKDLNGRTKQFFCLLNAEIEKFSQSKQMENIKLGDIVFQNVYFSYEKGIEVLHDISFTIQKGKTTAIVGESGSGKTTLISLLERFYVPEHGQILIDDQNIGKIPLDNWRELFSYVSQDGVMISGTIKDNILFGMDKKATDEQLKIATKKADIYDDIMNLPNNFDTDVGERGVNLSGGQKQRIAIARALIRNSKYLLLDEATANLDAHTEENINHTLQLLQNGKTTLIIAHKLSTIMNADHVIVLQNGKITGQGTHEVLLQNLQYYKELVEKQLQLYS